ncbi:MAG: class I SAM-dependent methyltransferase [Sediminibacterium sp.]
MPDMATIGPYYQSAAYVSHSDTDNGLINHLYHLVRNHTLQTKRKLVNRVTGKQKGTLLDVGAGTGAFATVMKEAGWDITGLEPDDTARRNALLKNDLILHSAEDIYTLPAAQYDVITLWHVLEHVHDLHGYFERFAQLLKPDGKLVLAVPNYTSYDAAIYLGYWAAYDVPRHLYHFSPEGMEQLGRLKGFTLQNSYPMWYDSFYVAMLSERYKNGRGHVFRAFWNGLMSNLMAWHNKKRCSSLIYIFSKR